MRIAAAGEQLCNTERDVAGLIVVQHGVVTRQQARTAGMTEAMIRGRLESGAWATLWPGVYSPATTADSWRRRVMGACLAGTTTRVASHRAAGALWQFDGRPPGIVEITIEGTGARTLNGVILHRSRSLPVADCATVDGIPLTRPARTLIDLAAVLEEDPLEEALDSALRAGLVTVPYLEHRLADLGTRGRDGVVVLRDLVPDRRGAKPAGSQAENRLRRALMAAGLPRPVRQYELYDAAGLAARFDLAYPEARIGIEFDSYRWHSGRRAWRSDHARHNRATALGWLVFHLTADSDVTPVAEAYAA